MARVVHPMESTIKLSLQNKILISFFSIIVVFTGLVLVIMQLNEQYLKQQQIDYLQSESDHAADTIERQVTSLKRILESNNPQLLALAANQNPQAWNDLAQHLQSLDPNIQASSLINHHGQVLYHYQPARPSNQINAPLIISDAHQRSITSQSQTTSAAYFIDGHQLVDIYTPVPTTDPNQDSLTLKTQYSLANLEVLQNRLRSSGQMKLIIIDQFSRSIFHPYPQEPNAETIAELPLIQALSNTTLEPESFYVNQFNVPSVGAASRVSTLDWQLLIEQDQDQAFGTITQTSNLLLIGLSASILLLLIIALILSNKIAQPVSQLTQAVKRLKKGGRPRDPKINTGDELENLSQAFFSMAQQLDQRQQSLEETNTTLSIEKDRHSTLLHSLTSGVFAVDANQTVTLFNKTAEKITGLKAKSVIGRPVDAALQFYRNDKLISIEDYANQTTRFKNRLRDQGLQFGTDNGDILLSLSVAPITDNHDEQAGWVVSFHDITQEKELEAMKLDFVSMAAHELRTPLTALRGYLSILEAEARDKLTTDEQTYLERSVVSGGQLSTLVENLLNLSRIERGSLKLDLTPIQPEEMIKTALVNLQEIANQRGVKIYFQQPDKPLPLILADNFRIAEVLTNLSANAINYSKPRNGWVKISAEVKKGALAISVADNGQGIPSSSIPRMFTKFYRVQSSLAMGSKGTGLGLFISKSIIDAHKGKIWVESEVNVGSTFTFTVPLAPKGSKAMIFGRKR